MSLSVIIPIQWIYFNNTIIFSLKLCFSLNGNLIKNPDNIMVVVITMLVHLFFLDFFVFFIKKKQNDELLKGNFNNDTKPEKSF